MSRFKDSIEVDAPVREVYDQWTQFEEFPEFMEGVKSVTQLDDRNLAWVAEAGGQERRWTAEITDQTPDTRIAWHSTTGAENAGAVLFKGDPSGGTTVTLTLDVDPEGPIDKLGDALGFVERRVKGDLERFKELMDKRRVASGSWRGEIHGDEVTPEDGQRPTTP